jgi:hypothetical protein
MCLEGMVEPEPDKADFQSLPVIRMQGMADPVMEAQDADLQDQIIPPQPKMELLMEQAVYQEHKELMVAMEAVVAEAITQTTVGAPAAVAAVASTAVEVETVKETTNAAEAEAVEVPPTSSTLPMRLKCWGNRQEMVRWLSPGKQDQYKFPSPATPPGCLFYVISFSSFPKQLPKYRIINWEIDLHHHG